MKFVFGLAMSAALSCASLAAAQDVATPTPAAEPATPAEAAVTFEAAPGLPALPASGTGLAKAGELILIQIAQDLSSKTAKAGDLFPITLASPITSDEGVLAPIGTRGVGQVVSVSKAGAFGKAGELVLAARYLEVDGLKIPLKAFKLGGSGDSNSNKIAVASMLAPLPIAIALLAVHGGDIEIPTGAVASAKISADVTLPVTEPAQKSASAAAEPTPVPNPTAGEVS